MTTSQRTRLTGVRIGGEPVDPRLPWTVPVTEPATGDTVVELVGGGRAEAARAVEVADRAQPGWARTSVGRRARALRDIAAELRDEDTTEELAIMISRETGKRLAEARAEVGLSAAFFDWFADAISTRGDTHWSVNPGLRHRVGQRPLGVVAVLSPWNFPLSIPARKIAPALAAGCAILFKPSEVAPSSAIRLAELVESHLPAGVLNTVLGEPELVSDAWLTDPRVRGLSFTGSTRVGRLLAASTAPRFLRCVLELGGNAPFVVLDDADLDHAVDVLMVAKYRNNGQSCIAANQVWVPEARLDAFVERFAAATDRLVLGDPLDPASTLGPLALPTDPARVAELVADSGAHTVTSSVEVPERGYYARPSIAVRPAATSRIVTEEIFGPAVSVCGYRELNEVLSATRANQYGLGGYVVGSPSRAIECASALDVGIVGVNTGTPNTPQVPFAGLKHSGLGAEGGQAGLDAFLSAQTVTEGLAV